MKSHSRSAQSAFVKRVVSQSTRFNPNSLRASLTISVIKALLLGALGLSAAVSQAQALTVTVSIPPLAGIIAPLLAPEDRLVILLKNGVSPHGFQLKPSHVKALQESDLILSVGTPVDSWVEKSVQRANKPALAMAELKGVERLVLREGGLWEDKHDHGHEHGHDHESQDEPVSDHEHENRHERHEESEQQYVEDRNLDGHIWMSPHNAKLLIHAVSEQLQAQRPEQKQSIQQRTQAWLIQLDKADQRIAERLQAVQSEPFLVLHDAFQYFERRYGLNGAGSIRLNPELAPSLKRVQELRERVKTGYVTCLFKEPQFPEKRVLSVVSGLDIRLGSLDPMGTSYSVGQPFMAYDAFLEALAEQFSSCLSTQ